MGFGVGGKTHTGSLLKFNFGHILEWLEIRLLLGKLLRIEMHVLLLEVLLWELRMSKIRLVAKCSRKCWFWSIVVCFFVRI